MHSLCYRRSILDEPSVALSPSDVSVDPIDVDEVRGGKGNFALVVVREFGLPCTMCRMHTIYLSKFLSFQDVSFLRNGTKWKRVSY